MEVLGNIVQLVIVTMPWGAAEHIFQFVRAVKPHSLRLQEWSFGAAGGITVVRHRCTWEGRDRFRAIIGTAHIGRDQRSWKFINFTQAVSDFCLQTTFVFQRFQHFFYLENGISMEVIFSHFFFNPQQLSHPDCSISFFLLQWNGSGHIFMALNKKKASSQI